MQVLFLFCSNTEKDKISKAVSVTYKYSLPEHLLMTVRHLSVLDVSNW